MSSLSVSWSATAPVTNNLLVYKNEDVPITFTAASATSILGWTLAFTLRAFPGASTYLVRKDNGSNGGISLTDTTNGVFVVTLSSANTTLAPGIYFYDAQRTDASNHNVLSLGMLQVLPEAYV